MELRQGKCPNCKVAYRWPAIIMPLKMAYCPNCGTKLIPTTHLLKWPWKLRHPISCSEVYQKYGRLV